VSVFRIFVLAAWTASFSPAQLTPDQKVQDFEQLAATFAKYYAPYEWKREVFRHDLYNLEPWVERVRAARDDLAFWEICSEYVARLQDTHSSFVLPSNFRANAGLGADIYGGKVLIDSISRGFLPAADYPFQIGDEVVAIDGYTVTEWLRYFSRFDSFANPRSTLRMLASYLFNRPQSTIPRAHEIGPALKLLVRRESGDLESYEIPWNKTGVALTSAGPVPSFSFVRTLDAHPRTATEPSDLPPMLSLLQERRAPDRIRLNGFGARSPVFAMPAGFALRLGRGPSDFHFSGTYQSAGKRIGFLRFRGFSPSSASAAITELESEIAFLEENTDGMVVDITRNTGGGCYGLEALRRLIPYSFELPGDEVRASLQYVQGIEFEYLFARSSGAPEHILALYQQLLSQLRTALSENRGRTGPTPFCAPYFEHQPARDRTGKLLAYTKPLVLLTDEFTVSWGDIFAAVIQDSRRGPLFGYRTNGAGGSMMSGPAGFFSETTASFSITSGVRRRPISTTDFGETSCIENVGVRPDMPYDYMTRDNLVRQGRPFVEAFTAAIVRHIDQQNREESGP
jgi:hypothetical protein